MAEMGCARTGAACTRRKRVFDDYVHGRYDTLGDVKSGGARTESAVREVSEPSIDRESFSLQLAITPDIANIMIVLAEDQPGGEVYYSMHLVESFNMARVGDYDELCNGVSGVMMWILHDRKKAVIEGCEDILRRVDEGLVARKAYDGQEGAAKERVKKSDGTEWVENKPEDNQTTP